MTTTLMATTPQVGSVSFDRQGIADHATNLAKTVQGNLKRSLEALGVVRGCLGVICRHSLHVGSGSCSNVSRGRQLHGGAVRGFGAEREFRQATRQHMSTRDSSSSSSSRHQQTNSSTPGQGGGSTYRARATVEAASSCGSLQARGHAFALASHIALIAVASCCARHMPNQPSHTHTHSFPKAGTGQLMCA